MQTEEEKKETRANSRIFNQYLRTTWLMPGLPSNVGHRLNIKKEELPYSNAYTVEGNKKPEVIKEEAKK